MKKIAFSVGLLLMIAAIAVALRAPLKDAAYDKLTQEMFVSADTDAFDPGPELDSYFPGLNARYQGRDVRLLDDFAGENGTVFLAVRSVDWCPYCMRQVAELQQHKAAYDAAGLGVVAITYDAPELQQAFVEKQGIEFPLLQDVDALTFKTLGILNEKYAPGEDNYGIPHPGMIVVDAGGVVRGKLFVEAYSSRVDALSSLAYAKGVLGLAP
ncbi:peroxiredoxin family protein [Halioglobus maricola]|uniref:Peroxiredoxin family protein n=1 Tax=Halioglobus maricola TaxID=2601894 RepID=A0A5P9NME0_9GAMM|nr:peroxiredoxin family protein [Halioglobus maricola]QFU76665.1 peroxiredoxin family protein [Halioglobus maricola]